MKKDNDNRLNNEVLYNDVLLLDRILQGEWKGTYKGYSRDNIDRAIIYAEFDMEYKFVHSRMANGCYISKDEKTGKDVVLSYDEYMDLIKSLTETNIVIIGSGEDKPQRKGYVNSPLKNKVNTAFQILYHIIDGADLNTGEYSEYESIPEPKAPENGTKLDYKIYEINLEEWRDEQNRLTRKRGLVINKKIAGKGADRKIYYKYLCPMGDFIEEHFRQKNVKSILNTSSKESFTIKSEIVDALVSDLNQDLIYKIREIEKDINEMISSDNSQSFVDSIHDKYTTALHLALRLGDPNEMASLLVCYTDYMNHPSIKSYYDDIKPFSNNDDDDFFLKECVVAIQKNATKTQEEIEKAARSIGSNWMERLEKGLEAQINVLRATNSCFLADMLFMFSKICMSIYNFDKALVCLEECHDIYIKSKRPQAISNLITIYTNLAKLHSDWNHCDEAIENAQLAIDCIKTTEMAILNKQDVSIFYATINNTIASIYMKQNDWDKTDLYLDAAYKAIVKESDENPSVFLLQLMISYNMCVLDTYKQDYMKAAGNLQLVLYKSILLYAINKTEENLVFKLMVQTALAHAQMKSGNFDDAEYNAVDALKELQKLYEQNPAKYSVKRLSFMISLADIYDEKDDNSESEKLYLKARKEAYELIESGVNIAKTTLYDLLTNLSSLYNKIGQQNKAIEIAEEALGVCDELISLNAEHYIIEIIKTLNNLSIAYYKTDNIEEALKLCQEAIDTCEGLMENGYSNPDMLYHYYYKVLHDYSVMVANFNE